MTELVEKKIMIVDDNEFSRVLILTKLKKHGYKNITTPETSIEAWDLIANAVVLGESFDLIITDLNMPHLDGMELITKIKEDPMSADTKIIVVSADADQVIKNITLSLGAAAYLVKPVVPKELVSVVEAVLSGTKIPEVKGMF
ncbi:MAG: response regulator [Ignavibacteriae bacterium]|nr:response regulator [Ignavibacteriota bacterium]